MKGTTFFRLLMSMILIWKVHEISLVFCSTFAWWAISQFCFHPPTPFTIAHFRPFYPISISLDRSVPIHSSRCLRGLCSMLHLSYHPSTRILWHLTRTRRRRKRYARYGIRTDGHKPARVSGQAEAGLGWDDSNTAISDSEYVCRWWVVPFPRLID